MKGLLLLILFTAVSCGNHQVKKSGLPLKTFSIGKLDLKLPGYYSIYILKDTGIQDKIYFTRMDTVVLVADKDFFGYLSNLNEYVNHSECHNEFDTIGDLLIFISTAELDDPYNSFDRLENEITATFYDLKKFGFNHLEEKIDSSSRYVLLGFRKASGCYLSKSDREELINAIRQSTLRKE